MCSKRNDYDSSGMTRARDRERQATVQWQSGSTFLTCNQFRLFLRRISLFAFRASNSRGTGSRVLLHMFLISKKKNYKSRDLSISFWVEGGKRRINNCHRKKNERQTTEPVLCLSFCIVRLRGLLGGRTRSESKLCNLCMERLHTGFMLSFSRKKLFWAK